MRPNLDYQSTSTRSQELLGGYYYPIMCEGHGQFRIRTYDIATNELEELVAAVEACTFLAFTKSGQTGSHLTVVDADFSLADLGLKLAAGSRDLSRQMVIDQLEELKGTEWRYGAYELLCAVRESRNPTRLPEHQFFSEDIVDLATQGADAQGNKLFKRAATITRAFRRVVGGEHFRIWVIEDEANVLEGFGFINPFLLNFANENIQMPPSLYLSMIQRAKIVKALDRLPISNARVVGRLINYETGEQIEGHIKCQLAVGKDMPPDVDFIVPAESIKSELRPTASCDWAIAGLEPQGPKPLFGDRQTINNHPFIISRPALRSELQDDATKALVKLVNGEALGEVAIATVDEFDAPFVWTTQSYNQLLRWSANAWAAYGMDYRDSPWFTLRLGLQWSQSLGWSDAAEDTPASQQAWNRTLKIPQRCAVREQIVSESSFNLVRDLVNAGKENPDHLEVPPGYMRQGHRDLPVMVVNDQDYLDILVPSHGGCDQDDFFLVMQREINAERSYLVGRNPNARGEYSVWKFFDGDDVWEHETSTHKTITFPKITKKRWPTQVQTALRTGETHYLPLPSSVDPNKTPADDRKAVMAEQDRILAQLREEAIPVDALLKLRLGNAAADLPSTMDSIFADSKGVLARVIGDYLAKVNEYCNTLPVPKYVAELGDSDALPMAIEFVRASRFQMFITQQSGGDRRDMMSAESAVLLRYIHQVDHPAWRAKAVMALWLACRVTPRSNGSFSDQPIFGTGVFRQDVEVSIPILGFWSTTQVVTSQWHLLDALTYYGIAQPPQMPDMPREQPFVKYAGGRLWHFRCGTCERGFLFRDENELIRFHHYHGICQSCRQAAEFVR